MKPAPYWHLRGRARQIAKAKFVRYYEDRATNPLLVFADLCRKFNLPEPEVKVEFSGDRLRLSCNGRSETILPDNTTYRSLRTIVNYLCTPAPATAEPTNNGARELRWTTEFRS